MGLQAKSLPLLGLAVLVAVLLCCCGNGTDTGSGLPAQRQQEIAAEVARLIADESTEEQRPHLQDGVVTPAEREAAFLAWVDCLEANGIDVASYYLRPRGGEGLNMSSEVLDDATVEETNEDCRVQQYKVVGQVFTYQNEPTAQEKAQWLRETADCLREKGFEVPDGPSFDEAVEIAPIEALRCHDLAAGNEPIVFTVP